MLHSAAGNATGIPQAILDAKAEEVRQRQEVKDALEVPPPCASGPTLPFMGRSPRLEATVKLVVPQRANVSVMCNKKVVSCLLYRIAYLRDDGWCPPMPPTIALCAQPHIRCTCKLQRLLIIPTRLSQPGSLRRVVTASVERVKCCMSPRRLRWRAW